VDSAEERRGKSGEWREQNTSIPTATVLVSKEKLSTPHTWSIITLGRLLCMASGGGPPHHLMLAVRENRFQTYPRCE